MTKFDYNYIGPSMNPTLKAGDILRIVPYKDDSISIGDIIVFNQSKSDRIVVHRVVSVDVQGIMTRGDNNSFTDPWILSPDQIVGRVLAVQRGNRKIVIYRGIRSRILIFMFWIVKRGSLTFRKILRPFYHWLIKSGIFSDILPRYLRPYIICFKQPDGEEMQIIMMGKWVIGKHLTGNCQWQIRHPFRLFVSETFLNSKEIHPQDSL